MTGSQVSERKALYRRFRALSDRDAARVLGYIDALEEREPNEESLAALKEAENLNNLESYAGVEALFDACGLNC